MQRIRGERKNDPKIKIAQEQKLTLAPLKQEEATLAAPQNLHKTKKDIDSNKKCHIDSISIAVLEKIAHELCETVKECEEIMLVFSNEIEKCLQENFERETLCY